MPLFFIMWDDETVAHMGRHCVTLDEFEEVILGARQRNIHPNKENGRWEIVGETNAGRLLKCVFEYIDDVTISPVDAFPMGEGE